MSWLAINLLVVAALILGGRMVLRSFFRKLARDVKNDPEYQAQIARLHESHAAEDSVREEASWLGSTGLPEDVERELPKYLRREFGELLLDADSLKARDLAYVGRFAEEGNHFHYWRIPRRGDEESFAYVVLGADGSICAGWGDREPPVSRAAIQPCVQRTPGTSYVSINHRDPAV